VPFVHSSILRLHKRSLIRGLALSLAAFAISLRLAGFPDIRRLHGSRWQLLVLCIAAWGMVDTARCLRPKWSLYHAGVLILLYSELMILALVMFLCIYP